MKRSVQIVSLVTILHLSLPREGKAEDTLDFKVMYYQESDDRIRVVSPGFLYYTDLSDTLSVKIDGVYDAISGASPTGTPGLSSYGIPGYGSLVGLNAVSGATPTLSAGPSPGAESDEPVSDAVSASDPADAGGDVPLGEMEDTRYAGNIELTGRRGEKSLSGKFSISTEDDYDSVGVAAKTSSDYDKRNTTLTYGASYNHDTIRLLSGDEEGKDVGDALIGVARNLNKTTTGKAIATAGFQSGFLRDQYKSVELNGVVQAENRPDSKLDMTVLFSLLHFVESAQAGLETVYRYYVDDFGINAHMLELSWNQELSPVLLVSPMFRYYQQTEADFYAVRFTGTPEYYSSDYRLSEMVSFSYGLKFRWQARQNLATDVSYERYEQDGRDGETHDRAYPSANIITAGAKLWF